MRTVAVCVVLLSLLLSGSRSRAQEVTTSPQAVPLITALTAAKASDVEGFKRAYSKKLQDDPSRDWNLHMRKAHDEMRKKFGDDYRLTDFTFKYVGDDSVGDVTAYHVGNSALNLGVIREGDVWKLGER